MTATEQELPKLLDDPKYAALATKQMQLSDLAEKLERERRELNTKLEAASQDGDARISALLHGTPKDRANVQAMKQRLAEIDSDGNLIAAEMNKLFDQQRKEKYAAGHRLAPAIKEIEIGDAENMLTLITQFRSIRDAMKARRDEYERSGFTGEEGYLMTSLPVVRVPSKLMELLDDLARELKRTYDIAEDDE